MLKINNKVLLSWDDIEDITNELCKKILLDIPQAESVFGYARGGLIPAVIISHKLGLPYVDKIYPNTVCIDDICDTGVTLENSIGVHTAVLFHKPHTSSYTPTTWAREHSGDEWIVFPWERKDSKEIQDYLAK